MSASCEEQVSGDREIIDVMGLHVMMSNVGVGHCGLATARSQALIAAV